MVNPLQFENSGPQWNSGLGYLFLLDNIIRLACGYLINGDYEAYYNSLESWYLSVIYWVDSSNKHKISEEEVKALKKLREEASPSQLKVLKNYHEKLDRLTNKAGLRLKSGSDALGVLKV